MAFASPAQIKKFVGRLVIGRLPGLVLDQAHRQALSDGTLGGITLFKENAADLEQLIKLTADIIDSSFHDPVLTVDQEGGAVQRFEHVLSALPSPMALAALNETYTTKEITSISSRQLKTLGFNMLLAPTLDLQTNAKNPIICTRAYGDRADTVTAIGAEVAAAIEAEGLIACAKHFPGHGSTVEDSHLELACVDKSEAELLAGDLVPFSNLSASLKAILIGHIWLPQLVSKKTPATLSAVVIEDLLRRRLKFEGLVVSDDMIMRAITHGYGLGEACVQALLAGVDLLLVCGTFEQSKGAVETISAAVASGRVSEARLRQAVERIDQLFSKRSQPLSSENVAAVENFAKVIEQDSAICRKTSARAVSVMRGEYGPAAIARLKEAKLIVVVAPAHPRYPLDLAEELRRSLTGYVNVVEVRYPLNPGDMAVSEIGTVAGTVQAMTNITAEKSLTIFLSYRTAINTGQTALCQMLAPDLHIATDSPYDLAYLPGLARDKISLALFDPSNQAMAALADVLTGEVAAQGRCPVEIFPSEGEVIIDFTSVRHA